MNRMTRLLRKETVTFLLDAHMHPAAVKVNTILSITACGLVSVWFDQAICSKPVQFQSQDVVLL